MNPKRIITFGTFDLFHIGHVEILRRAKELGSVLIVGVSSDALNFSKKKIYPVYPLADRLDIVRSVRYVDEVFVEESLELKREYLLSHRADVLVMGNDWAGRFDEFKDVCEVVYLSRTPFVSSSEIKIVCQKPDARLPERFDPYVGGNETGNR
ncbi:MAG: glycerol-3-phosphate cytidylyltransferase [Lentisphaerae bacterium GWF2_57_35]|nr:MAG: glycerol-3-phosphate cytidylyltransferase [Lentisphaerae bacterium GWF2_57_35]